MLFLKLRLSIERFIRAKDNQGNLGSAPMRIAIVGKEDDSNIQVYIHPSESYHGSPAQLEMDFNKSLVESGSIYPLNETATPRIEFGIFTPDEFQRLNVSSSSSGTLPQYSLSSSKRSDLSNIPAKHFKYNIDELNVLLHALQYRVIQMSHSTDFDFIYHPDVSGDLRLTAAILIQRKKDETTHRRNRCTSFEFAQLIASKYLDFSFAGGPIKVDHQYTTKGESGQNIQLKLDASPLSMLKIRYHLLQFMLPQPLKLSSHCLLMRREKLVSLCSGGNEHDICWHFIFSPGEKNMIDLITTFLKEAGFKDCTEEIAQNPPVGKKTDYWNDLSKLPQKPLEFIVEKPTEGEPNHCVKVNASAESFAAIIKTLWENYGPKSNEKNHMKY